MYWSQKKKSQRRLPALRRLRRETDGATAVEMAFIMPVLVFATIMILEIGMIFLVNVIIEGATSTASRTAKTGAGSGDPNISREDFIKAEIVRLSLGLLDPASPKFRFTLTGYEGAELGGTAGSAGTGGDIVVINVVYEWDLFTPFAAHFLQNPYEIEAQATYRNEPF